MRKYIGNDEYRAPDCGDVFAERDEIVQAAARAMEELEDWSLSPAVRMEMCRITGRDPHEIDAILTDDVIEYILCD